MFAIVTLRFRFVVAPSQSTRRIRISTRRRKRTTHSTKIKTHVNPGCGGWCTPVLFQHCVVQEIRTFRIKCNYIFQFDRLRRALTHTPWNLSRFSAARRFFRVSLRFHIVFSALIITRRFASCMRVRAFPGPHSNFVKTWMWLLLVSVIFFLCVRVPVHSICFGGSALETQRNNVDLMAWVEWWNESTMFGAGTLCQWLKPQRGQECQHSVRRSQFNDMLVQPVSDDGIHTHTRAHTISSNASHKNCAPAQIYGNFLKIC